MFRRRKAERPSPEAAASLEQAVRDAAEQREKLDAEISLRRALQQIRAKNHLAEELYSVLSERRNKDGGNPDG